MNSETEAVKALRSKVETYLRDEGLSYEVKPDGKLMLRKGTTAVTIQPLPWEKHTLVRVLAPVALNIQNVTPALTQGLLEKNNELLFGKFSLDIANRAVWFEHVLLGDFLDADELLVAVVTVAVTADRFDETVAELARGQRVADL